MNAPDRILFCGDPHGRFDHILLAAADPTVAAVILLGDLQAQEPLHESLGSIAEKTWFIHGNHDTDSVQDWDHVWNSKVADRNIDGRVITLNSGLRIAGLGGVFRESVWHPDPGSKTKGKPVYMTPQEHAKYTPRQDRLNGLQTRKHWSSIYRGTVDKLAGLKADVLVTHEAPSYHPHGFEVLDELARDMGASFTIHGHQHDCIDSSRNWAAQGFKSFGVGLRGISALSIRPNAQSVLEVVLPGEMDQARHGFRTLVERG